MRRRIIQSDLLLPTQAEIDELFAFLPLFSALGYQPVREWHGGPTGKEKSLAPWPRYDDAVEAFMQVAAKECWSDPTYKSSVAAEMLNAQGRLQDASLSDIRSMLTFCIRGERFCDGHIASMISEGHVRRILERLVEITRSEPIP